METDALRCETPKSKMLTAASPGQLLCFVPVTELVSTVIGYELGYQISCAFNGHLDRRAGGPRLPPNSCARGRRARSPVVGRRTRPAARGCPPTPRRRRPS